MRPLVVSGGRGRHTQAVLFRLENPLNSDGAPVESVPSPESFLPWALGAGVLLIGLLILHKVVSLTVKRFLPNPSMSRRILVGTGAPIRVILAAVALLAWLDQSSLAEDLDRRLTHFTTIVLMAGIGFLFIRLVWVTSEELVNRLPLKDPTNLKSRRAHTQVSVLRRLASVTIGLLTAGAIMWTVPAIRALGASVLASAGLIGLLAGVAARATFVNLIAGLQIAFAEPIRLDDIVVVGGDQGTVEEITLTYVVLRTGDRRRIIVPSSWFIENRFENWTKSQSALIGSVFLYLNLTADVSAVRAEALRFISTLEKWDGDVATVSVVDAGESKMKVRIQASGANSAAVFDLRIQIREHMLHWMAEHRPADLVGTGDTPADVDHDGDHDSDNADLA